MTRYAVPFHNRNSVARPPSLQGDLQIMRSINKANHQDQSSTPATAEQGATQFASALAHEMRNPLTNINLSVKLLESAIKDDDLKAYLDIITRSSIRINDLLKELLKYQQHDEVAATKHSICRLLDEVIAITEDRIMLKNITLRKNYAKQDFKLLLDRPKMKIALSNIMVNAIDSMDRAKGELTISTKSIYGKYVVQIEDNGCGISTENLKKIFDPYYTNKTDGLGLGLSTTYNILRSNRTELHVESKEGEGTRFILFFDKDQS
jgi:signal transduction histidine kinase